MGGTGKIPLAFTAEVLFFAVLFLILALIALYSSLVNTDSTRAAIVCGILAVAIPVLIALLID